MGLPRRSVVLAGLLPGLADAQSPERVDCAAAPGIAYLPPCEPWPQGPQGQRRADRGDGRYLNPVLAGDRPDPTLLQVGEDYYCTHSSFEALPGLLIWHSRDLVNWRPLVNALQQSVGSVWAPELVRHGGRYFIYLPVKAQHNDILVIHAERIEGPWSAPLALGLPRHIDPGHAVGEDGRRYLFLSGGDRVRLSDDGLRLEGPVEHVFDGWRYPEDWVVESYSQEGPKILRHGGWFHMLLAIGGTAGPPTGHMVVAARSRSIHGPWEHAPHNPLLRTRSPRERWWSRGHGSLVRGPHGDWWLAYHGYEHGFHTLGRQMLLAPARFAADGWFHVEADDGAALPMPARERAVAHGQTLSDDFQAPRLQPQWAFLAGGPGQLERVQVGAGALRLQASGSGPADSPPLGFIQGDPAFELEFGLDFDEGVQAGVLLFYSPRLYAGLGVNARALRLHRYGLDQRALPKPAGHNADDYPTVVAVRHMSELLRRSQRRQAQDQGLQQGALGSEKETIDQVKIGALDITRVNVGPMNSHLPADAGADHALPVPLDRTHAQGARRPGGRRDPEELRPPGLRRPGLLRQRRAFSIYAKKPMKTVADAKGLKIRVQQSDLWVAPGQRDGRQRHAHALSARSTPG
jgi:xylan 1,4-beta-xylosidase